MRTPSRYIFRLPSHEINPFRATLFLILLICAVLAGVSWLILFFVRTGKLIHLLVSTFCWISAHRNEAGKNQSHQETPNHG